MKKSLIKGKKIQKIQNLTKHDIENWVAMATSYTLDNFFLQSLVLQ